MSASDWEHSDIGARETHAYPERHEVELRMYWSRDARERGWIPSGATSDETLLALAVERDDVNQRYERAREDRALKVATSRLEARLMGVEARMAERMRHLGSTHPGHVILIARTRLRP